MSDAPDRLQFEEAEPVRESPVGGEPDGIICTGCGASQTELYWAINGRIVCAACREKVLAYFAGGSGLRRFVRAVLFGGLAGALGSAIYYAVLKLTGYEVGLIAIVVGWLVGGAVRRGSDARGGKGYQLLAVLLTYAAIVTTYIPFIVESLAEEMVGQTADAGASAEATVGATAPVAASPPAEPAGAVDLLAGGLLALLLLYLIAFAAPFLGGVQNLLGWVIIGFALYQAWIMNRKLVLEVSGPHAVGSGPASAPAVADG